MISIEPYEHVDGIRFGDTSSAVLARLGSPESRSTNRRGERQLCYRDAIWRFHGDQLVETTITMRSPVRLRDQEVASFRAWLPTVDSETVTIVGFLVSRAFGVAVDLDEEGIEYVTVFERGRWDHLL
jgi:hypothetical protein